MGKVRKGGKGHVGEKPKKTRRPGKDVHAGQSIWCDNCKTKGVHKHVREVVRCYDRHVAEGTDFYWVR